MVAGRSKETTGLELTRAKEPVYASWLWLCSSAAAGGPKAG